MISCNNPRKNTIKRPIIWKIQNNSLKNLLFIFAVVRAPVEPVTINCKSTWLIAIIYALYINLITIYRLKYRKLH